MDSKDIGLCLLNTTNNRNTLFSLSVVCKSYNRAFQELKPQILKRYNIDIDEYNLYRAYNLKLKKNKTQQKNADVKLQRILVKFFNKASEEFKQKRHTSIIQITRGKCKYPKTLNITSRYVNQLIDHTLAYYFNAKDFKCSRKEHDREIEYYIRHKGELVYKIVVTNYSKVIFINVQLYERYMVHFITNIVKRNKKSGTINLRDAEWSYYQDLVPKKIRNHWITENGWSWCRYVRFRYKSQKSHLSY